MGTDEEKQETPVQELLFNRLMFMKKFFYSMTVLFVVTITCGYLKYDGTIYRDMIIGVSGMFLVAQAYSDTKKKQ